MTPDQMRLKAVEALTEEFDRTHEDPRFDADRWIGRLMRNGWRPIPALADRPSDSRRAPAAVAAARIAEAQAAIAGVRGNRPEAQR